MFRYFAQPLKIYFLYFCIVCWHAKIVAMEENITICMTIFKEQIHTNNKDLNMHMATLQGFDKRCKNILISDENIMSDGHLLIGGKKYKNPKDIEIDIDCDIINQYPLFLHRKIAKIPRNYKLIIRKEMDEQQFECIPIPEELTKNIITFLLHDSCDPRKCCVQFACEIFFGKCDYEACDTTESEITIGESVVVRDSLDELNLVPSDVLILLKKTSFESRFKFLPVHYAIVLGDICVSKFGNGKQILVTQIMAMTKFYQADGFAKIKKEAKIAPFMFNPLTAFYKESK